MTTLLETAIKNELHCIECWSLIITVIWQFSSGGNICLSCFHLKRCLSRFPRQMMRNWTLEKLRLLIRIPCKYKSFGCETEETIGNLPFHEMSLCYYSLRKCPFSNISCDWEGPFSSLEGHCRDSHPEYMLKDSGDGINVDQDYCFIVFEYATAFLCSWCVGTKCISVENLRKSSRNEMYSFVELRSGTDDGVEIYSSYYFSEKLSSNPLSIPDNISRETSSHDQLIFKWKVEIMYSAPVRKKPLEQDVLSNLCCSKCSKILTPPLGRCVYAHDYCAMCDTSPELHPRCVSHRKSNSGNLSLEKIIIALTRNCNYAHAGCTYQGFDALEHEKICDYGPSSRCTMRSWSDYCRWRGSEKESLQHAAKHCSLTLGPAIEFSIFMSVGLPNPYTCHLFAYGRIFRFSRHYKLDGNLFTACYYFGDTSNKGHFRCEIIVIKEGCKKTPRFGIMCCPIAERDFEAFNAFYSAVCCTGWKRYCDDHGELRFEMQLIDNEAMNL